MTPGPLDPYKTLGVEPGISDDRLHSVYRRLVQQHHPDHNGGSPESARRFEEIQEAYQRIRQQRAQAPPASSATPPPPTFDPDVVSRLADLERELRDAQAAREQARRVAREAAAATYNRPTDEELGYVTTEDSLSKLLADARVELSDRLAQARGHPAGQRVADLIDDLAEKLSGGARRRPPD